MSLYGALYGSQLGSAQTFGLFPTAADMQRAQWTMLSHDNLLAMQKAEYEAFRRLGWRDPLANSVPPWVVEADRERYRTKADAAGGDTAYSRSLDARIAAARGALRKL